MEGEIVWVDNSDANGLRPRSVKLTLYANGTKTDEKPDWTDTVGDVWAYCFGGLLKNDAHGNAIVYSVIEAPIERYATSRSGTDFTNTLLERQPVDTMSISGTAKWQDGDNAYGIRPASVTIRLIRDGEVLIAQTVTEAGGWQYTFEGLPTGDGYGHTYRYTISEAPVAGYAARVDGYDVIHIPLADLSDMDSPQTPDFSGLTEEELEDQIWLYDYEPQQTGALLKTGDELPRYPFVFAGFGALAMALAFALGKKKGRVSEG